MSTLSVGTWTVEEETAPLLAVVVSSKVMVGNLLVTANWRWFLSFQTMRRREKIVPVVQQLRTGGRPLSGRYRLIGKDSERLLSERSVEWDLCLSQGPPATLFGQFIPTEP